MTKEHDTLTIYFKKAPETPVSFSVTRGFVIVAPYSEMYQFVDINNVQRAFNWNSVESMIVLRGGHELV